MSAQRRRKLHVRLFGRLTNNKQWPTSPPSPSFLLSVLQFSPPPTQRSLCLLTAAFLRSMCQVFWFESISALPGCTRYADVGSFFVRLFLRTCDPPLPSPRDENRSEILVVFWRGFGFRFTLGDSRPLVFMFRNGLYNLPKGQLRMFWRCTPHPSPAGSWDTPPTWTRRSSTTPSSGPSKCGATSRRSNSRASWTGRPTSWSISDAMVTPQSAAFGLGSNLSDFQSSNHK